jgi:hypothetical protein
MLQDLRDAARGLVRTPGFTAAAKPPVDRR